MTVMEEERWQKLHDKFLAELNRERGQGEDIEAYDDRVNATLDALELALEVKRLRGCLEAVSDVVSDAAAYGDDIPAGKVLEAARGQRTAVKKVSRIIGFGEIQAGDVLQVSFPPRGGMSDNWTMTHSREAIAYRLEGEGMLSYWMTGDGQSLVSALDDRAIIKLIARLARGLDD